MSAVVEATVPLDGASAQDFLGDVDCTRGAVNCPGDLNITGSILDQARVCAGGTIRVSGAIDAAEVQAGGDLLVEGGILGRHKGLCRAGGGVTAKFLANACIEARGDVRIAGDISNSKVTTAGMVDAAQGTIQGGSLVANGGIRCLSLGSVAGTSTTVAAGIDQALHQRASVDLKRLDVLYAKAVKVHETIAPLMRNPKKLTAAQKEKATELLYEASEVARQIAPELEQLERELARSAAAGRCEIHVEQFLQPGVVVQFPGVKTTIERAAAGPLLLTVRQFGREKRILLQNIESKNTFELLTCPIGDDCAALISRMIEKLRSLPAA